MRQINADPTNYKRHNCIGHQEGDWIFFTCSQCSYQRRYNYRTGKMLVTEGEDPTIMHHGGHNPVSATMPLQTN